MIYLYFIFKFKTTENNKTNYHLKTAVMIEAKPEVPSLNSVSFHFVPSFIDVSTKRFRITFVRRGNNTDVFGMPQGKILTAFGRFRCTSRPGEEEIGRCDWGNTPTNSCSTFRSIEQYVTIKCTPYFVLQVYAWPSK